MTDKTRLAAVLKALALAYPAAKIERGTLDVYANQLADVPIDSLEEAANRVMRTSTFFPSIAELRNVVAECEVGDTSRAMEQFGMVMRAIRNYSTQMDPQPKFDDPITEHVVTMMGWKAIGLMNLPDLADQFKVNYATLRKNTLREVQASGSTTEDAIMLRKTSGEGVVTFQRLAAPKGTQA